MSRASKAKIPGKITLRQCARAHIRAGVRNEGEFVRKLDEAGILPLYSRDSVHNAWHFAKRDVSGLPSRKVSFGVVARVRELYDNGKGMLIPNEIWHQLTREGIYTTPAYVGKCHMNAAKAAGLWRPDVDYAKINQYRVGPEVDHAEG